ncbi:hypothetical protein COCOBI_12-0520 [Coccomyxa sp. Obi]|nr:hypothetical protein COCOBI_12-0520 [Coccomyxa sp. Obi]
MLRRTLVGLPLYLIVTGVLCRSDRGLLQAQRPPCISRVSGWFQCGTAEGQSPGALCLPLCIGDSASGPCQPCSNPNNACNTAWRSYNGVLQASLVFNSTEICPQLADRMTARAAGGDGTGGGESNTCSCPCAAQQPQN